MSATSRARSSCLSTASSPVFLAFHGAFHVKMGKNARFWSPKCLMYGQNTAKTGEFVGSEYMDGRFWLEVLTGHGVTTQGHAAKRGRQPQSASRHLRSLKQ